jgi:geranylgeranyl diphosphate synthase, type II
MLESSWRTHASRVDQYLQGYMEELGKSVPDSAKDLVRSMEYSLFTGGKRFRPLVCLLTAETLNVGVDRALPFSAALEMVHTYSLIHDDLPCMDNDDLRRGKPTNHVEFGQAMALLAGDALLTEAPRVIAKSYEQVPQVAVELIDLLASASGAQGMISGQVLDLRAQGRLKNQTGSVSLNQVELEELHRLKTGQLIYAAVMGAGIVGRADANLKEKLSEFGQLLGLAFQLADDIHDDTGVAPEASGFPKLLGRDGTRKLLEETSERAIQWTMKMGPEASLLRELVVYNLERTH